MKLKDALDKIRDMSFEDGGWYVEITVEDMLDYMALIGIEGASEAYFSYMADKLKSKGE